jgi:hypothetical protein
VQDGRGASDFDALRSAMRWKPQCIILYVFDLLHLDGKDLRHQPLSEPPHFEYSREGFAYEVRATLAEQHQ